MKKTYLTTFSFVLLFPFLLLSQEIEVPQTNQPLITKRTATWCPNCGTYGWTLFRDLLADQQSNALLIAAHFGSSVLANEAGDGVVDILGGFGQPTFFLNTDNLGANSGNIAVVRQDVASTVAQINDTPPVAQTGILAEATDDSLIVHTKTAFFEAVENASVNLAVYLIEPDVVATQSQQGPMAAHKNIIRYEMSGAAAGQTIADGGAVAGTEVERRYSISIAELEAQEINTANLGNQSLIVAAVLWVGSPGDYEVLNTNNVRETVFVTSTTNDLAAKTSLQVFPLPAASEATLALNLEERIEDASLTLINANGQMVRTLYRGALVEGGHQFVVAKNQLPAGTYWLQLSDGNQLVNRQVIFR